jgi:hypothetical protein
VYKNGYEETKTKIKNCFSGTKNKDDTYVSESHQDKN